MYNWLAFPSLIHLPSGLIFDTVESMDYIFNLFFHSFYMLNVMKWSVKKRQDRQLHHQVHKTENPECHTGAWAVERVNGCGWGLWCPESNSLSTLPFKQQPYKKMHVKPNLNQRRDDSVPCMNILVIVAESLFHTSVFQYSFSVSTPCYSQLLCTWCQTYDETTTEGLETFG